MLSRNDRRRVFEITRDVALRIYREESFDLDTGKSGAGQDSWNQNGIIAPGDGGSLLSSEGLRPA